MNTAPTVKYYKASCAAYSSGSRDRVRRSPQSDPEAYDRAFEAARDRPEEFWAKAAEEIVWHKKWNKVLDTSKSPFTQWFQGGELSVCYNAVDRHVENGRGDQVALIFDSPVTNTVQKITYKELQSQVMQLAAVLRKQGVGPGDVVLIYMPMVPEAVVAMLATIRLGAIHSLVFGGFASAQLATRINHAAPKVIISSNCGKEPNRVVNYKPLLDKAIEMSENKPKACIILNRKHSDFEDATLIPGRDLCYQSLLGSAAPLDCVPVGAMDPMYLLYTSGTTGVPKAVVRPSGGHAVVLNWSMYNIYGIHPGEVWFAASDLGWVVGHSYICYAPLIYGATSIVYEGKPIGTPDPGKFFQMLQDYNVAGMFVAPTALRAIMREDSDGIHARQYNHPNFRYLFVAGEHCDGETMEWSQNAFKSPVLDNWWQTETGHAMTGTCVGLGNDLYPPHGVAGRPVPGWDVRVIRETDMTETGDHTLGQIVAKLPLPPGSFSTLWQAEQRYMNTYFRKFQGYYDTMDSGFRDENGYIAVMARSDDVINVAGHRLSSGQLEEAVLLHHDVVEAAVVGKPDSLKGQVPIGLCVVRSDTQKADEEVIREVKELVRSHVGAVAAFKDAVIVKRLPKTRSGKVSRNTIANMIAGKPYEIPVTIEDAAVYPELEEALKNAGYNVAKAS